MMRLKKVVHFGHDDDNDDEDGMALKQEEDNER